MAGTLRSAVALDDPVLARRADRDELSLSLIDARNRTLRWLEAFEASASWGGGPGCAHQPWLCLGRAGWFQEFWIARHVQRSRGEAGSAEGGRGGEEAAARERSVHGGVLRG